MLTDEQVNQVIETLNMIKGAKRQRVTTEKVGSTVNLLDFQSLALQKADRTPRDRTGSIDESSGGV